MDAPSGSASWVLRNKWDVFLTLSAAYFAGWRYLGRAKGSRMAVATAAYGLGVSVWTRLLWARFQRRVALQRCTKHLYVIHSGTDHAGERQVVEAVCARGVATGMLVTCTPASQWNPFSMLWGSVAVVFVVNEDAEARAFNSPLSDWLASEANTRLIEGNHYGHVANIVYTQEGHRRTAFLRVKYAVLSVVNEEQVDAVQAPHLPWSDPNPSFGYQVDEYMDAFSAYRLAPRSVIGTTAADGTVASAEALRVALDRVSDALQRRTVLHVSQLPEPMPGWSTFWNWMWACPCCDQIEVEKMRIRPSRHRLSLGHMLLMAAWHRCARGPVMRHVWESEVKGRLWVPFAKRLAAVWYMVVHPLFHRHDTPYRVTGAAAQPQPTAPSMDNDERDGGAEALRGLSYDPPPGAPPLCPVPYRLVFGDESLLDDVLHQSLAVPGAIPTQDELTQEPGTTGWIVNPELALIPQQPVLPPCHRYSLEFVGRHMRRGFGVRDPATQLWTFVQVMDDQQWSLLSNVEPGQEPPPDLVAAALASPKLCRWLALTNVLVRPTYVADVCTTWDDLCPDLNAQLHQQGFVVLPRRTFHPLILATLRRYNHSVVEWFGGIDMAKKFSTWNDEPVARYLQHATLPIMERIVGEPMCHSSLALSIFIRAGQGFQMHTDSSPPFDITLDLCVDHQGPVHRTVYLSRRNPGSSPVPLVHKLDLNPGEAVLFKGSEMAHWGGDLPKGAYHNVVLTTYQYVRD